MTWNPWTRPPSRLFSSPSTRLATAVAESARKLGCTPLWGRCSEAELSLPYLPFVEAIGNELDEQMVLNAGLAIEERAGFTARPEKWW